MAHGSLICLLPGIQPKVFMLLYGSSYQLFQYIMGVRVYIPTHQILVGHTLKHLINKLSEYVFGFLMTMLMRKLVFLLWSPHNLHQLLFI
jgi:hypothetical protein